MPQGDREHWVASHERMPFDPFYDEALDGFGNPEFMFPALEQDAEDLEDLEDLKALGGIGLMDGEGNGNGDETPSGKEQT